MNLTRQQYPLGWTPDSDALNGSPEGLLRMDNLQFDEDGALSLVRGISQITTGFSGYVDQIYSKILNVTEYVYLSLAGGSIQRGQLNGSFSEIAIGNQRATFGDCLGQILIFAGQTRLKDNGTSNKKLGLATPGTPTVSVQSQQYKEISGGWSVSEGTIQSQTSTGTYTSVDQTSVRGSVTLNGGGDTLNIGGSGQSKDPNQDIFEMQFTPDDSSVVSSVEVRINTGGSSYYRFVWTNQDLTQGISQTSTLSCKRGDFTDATAFRHRLGAGRSSTSGWNTVDSIQIIVVQTSYTSFNVDHVTFTGGALGQLNGTYQWVQVNINDNGTYVAKSPFSVATGPISVNNGYVSITPGSVDEQTTDVWIFRITVAGTNTGTSTNSSTALSTYYRTGTAKPGVQITDSMADLDAIQLGITGNPFLKTMRAGDPNSEIDDIFSVEGMWNSRMLYMSVQFLLLSDVLNPDAIDARYTVKAFGDPTEKNLWVSRVSNNVYVLGTNKNLYEISGTLQPLPDGTLDINVYPIGEKYPPITNDHCLIGGGGIVYMGSDGPRQTQGSNSTLLSPSMKLLFQGETRHGVPAVIIDPAARYAIAAGKTRLYISVPTTDGGNRLLIYDLIKKQWRLQYTDPISIWSTQTDRILMGYNLPNGLFELDVSNGITVQGGQTITGIPMTFQTVFDHNGQPRNRKDTFTLKIICDTGGMEVDVYIAKDGGPLAFLGAISCTGVTTNYFPLNGYTLGFRYQLKLIDKSYLNTFKLYETTIEYEPRPEQLDYLRIQPENLGTISRKRIVNYAFVIDTLGNAITFTPFIDNSNTGVLPATSIVNTPAKQTYIHYFTQEQIGTDLSGTLAGGVFEFYRVATEEIISEKMPVPVEYLVIPPNNYGTPDRKRHSSYKFQINTRGHNVKFTPIIDGTQYPSHTYNTTTKKTVEYFFSSDTIGIDIGGILDSLGSGPFEYYGVVEPQQIEKLPNRLEFFLIPPNDYGKPNRKRHTSYKFQINTNGSPVTFIPIVDGLQYNPTVFNTPSKATVEHYFTQAEGDVIGIDIGGSLSGSQPFEFYGVVIPQEIEGLPPRLEYLRIPNNNFGIAARKRLRTIPLVIDTYGRNTTFTPIVDGVPDVANISTFNTNGKTTVYHFFSTDSFGIDYGGILQCASGPYEFYELMTPEDVEVLPVPRKYHQVGPVYWDKIGKVFEFRIRMIMTGTTIGLPYRVLGDLDSSVPTYDPLFDIARGTISVIPNRDVTYTVQFPKSVNTNIFRMVLGPTTDYFHFYEVTIRVSQSGMESDARWIPIAQFRNIQNFQAMRQ